MTGPVAPGLRARLAEAEAVLAGFRQADEARAASPSAPAPDYRASAYALAASLHSAAVALRGALQMLQDSDDVLAQQDSTMTITTGGLAVSVADAPVVAAALAEAAEYRRSRAEAWCEACQRAVSGACDEHASDLEAADAYDAVAARIGGER